MRRRLLGVRTCALAWLGSLVFTACGVESQDQQTTMDNTATISVVDHEAALTDEFDDRLFVLTLLSTESSISRENIVVFVRDPNAEPSGGFLDFNRAWQNVDHQFTDSVAAGGFENGNSLIAIERPLYSFHQSQDVGRSFEIKLTVEKTPGNPGWTTLATATWVPGE